MSKITAVCKKVDIDGNDFLRMKKNEFIGSNNTSGSALTCNYYR
jgi:hypothetical protein